MAKLFDFQRTAVANLLSGKRFIISGTGSGKTAMALVWADQCRLRTGKRKLLVVTTASKSKTGDFEREADEWSPDLKENLDEFSVISWHKLRDWTKKHLSNVGEYIVVFDEVAKASAGVSSGMGKAFLTITKETKNWSAFTATPGDNWLKFYPYFTACGFIKNKTNFMSVYAKVQTYKGFPEIVGWNREDELKSMWAKISYAPDTSKVMNELPEQTHHTVLFKRPTNYTKVLTTRTNAEGDFLDTSGALCSELRRICFTKDKQEWVEDFVEGLESGCVFFYNFIKTGDMLEKIIKKALVKGARIWRIDGTHHEIPNADTIGPNDMVLCQWQSGSEALNLQFLHYWVSVEACYSYSTSIQARGRIRRIGQKWPQTYWYLKTEGTIEDAIYEALKTKSDFSEENWCVSKGIKEDL